MNDETYTELGNELGMKMCRAFNLDPDVVRSLSLHVSAHSVPILTVCFIVDPDDVEKLLDEVVEDYRVHLSPADDAQ